jgi:hypothetical protein
MATTLATALTAVRVLLDETTGSETSGAWPNPQLRRWVNEACKDIARRTESLQTKTTISATAGTQEYTLPAAMTRVTRVEWQPDGSSQLYPLEYADFNNMDSVWWTQQAITQQTPRMYTMWGYPPSLKLVIYPKPPSAGTFNVFYYALPTALATDGTQDSSTLPIPEGWEDCVYAYVEYMALRKDRDQRWQEARQIYEGLVTEMIDLTQRWTDQSGGAFQPNTPMVPSWLYNDGGWW